MTRPRRRGARKAAILLACVACLACAGPATPPQGTAPEATHAPAPMHAPMHAHHGFANAEQWAQRFDDPARDAWQRPDAVLARLELHDGMRVADIGSGTGYFSVRLARALPAGRVYGVDIEPDMVRYLAERAEKDGLHNLESRLGRPDDPLLPEPVDLVLMVDTYHHLDDPIAYFRRLRGSLAPGGRVAIVDFKAGALPVGPPDSMKVPADRILEEMQAAGYRVAIDDRTLLPYQNLLVFAAAPPHR